MVRGDWLREPVVGRAALVREHGPEAGGLQWGVLENVRAWLLAEEGARDTLVLAPVPDAEDRSRYLQVVIPLLEHLDGVVRGVGADASAEERLGSIARASASVAEWAEEAGAFATGAGYAQVAAALLPEEPWRAYHVGRLARKAGEAGHAVAWLRRAGWLARERGDADTLVLVLEGLGHVRREGGRLRRATSYYRRACELARQGGRAALAGDMLADLCLAELEMGNLAGAAARWEQALALHGPGDSRIVPLAQEAAWLLMEVYGVFHSPFLVFDALLEHVWEPRGRIFLQAHRARAAAGVHQYREFERSCNEAVTLALRAETHRVRAAALVQLSLAAALLRNFPRASYVLSQVVPPSRSGRDDDSVAARLKRALDGDRPAEALGPVLDPPLPSAAEEAEARTLCTSVVARLRLRDRGDLFIASRREPELALELVPRGWGGGGHPRW